MPCISFVLIILDFIPYPIPVVFLFLQSGNSYMEWQIGLLKLSLNLLSFGIVYFVLDICCKEVPDWNVGITNLVSLVN